MVGGTITFDPEQVAPGRLRIADREIDPVTFRADLRIDLITPRPYSRQYFLLERRLRLVAGWTWRRKDAVLGEAEVLLEGGQAGAAGLYAEIIRGEIAEHLAPMPRPSDEHVEAP